MKSYAEIKEEINNLINKGKFTESELKQIADSINKHDTKEKKELFSYFLAHLYKYDSVIKYFQDNSDKLEMGINNYKKFFKEITGLSDDEVNEIFLLNGMSVDKIKEYIDLLEELKSLEKQADIEGISILEWLEKDIANLENKKNIELDDFKKTIEMIESVLKEKRVNMTVEELQQEIDRLAKEQENIVKNSFGGPSSEQEERYHEINNIITKIKKEISWRNEYKDYSVEELKAKIANLREEQRNIAVNSMEYPNEEDERRYHEINELVSLLESEIVRKNRPVYLNYSDEKIKEEINKLKEEQHNIMVTAQEYPTQEEQARFHEINDLVNKMQKELEARQSNPYKKYEFMSIEELQSEINKLKNNSSVVKEKYDKLIERRKKQIEIVKKRNDKINITKESRKDLLYKSLAAIAGFGVGFTLSAVPGVGQVRMVLATAKLVTSAVNVWTNKHPEGKVAKIIDITKDKISEFGDKFPRISAAVNSAYEKIKKVTANEKVNWFINGMSAGYITGNVIELVSGKTWLENLRPNPEPAPTPEVVVKPESTPDPTPVPVANPVDIPDIKPGEVFDLSGISEGLASSDSENFVNLLTSAGKDAVVDKIVTLPDGTQMVHFLQSNGLGYAWFNLDDVKNYLEATSQVVETVAKTM